MEIANTGIPIEDTFEINKVLKLFFKSFQNTALAVIPIVIIESSNFESNAFDNIDFTISDYYVKERIEKFIFENKKGKIKKLKYIFDSKVKETNECFDLFTNNIHYENRKNYRLLSYRRLFGLPNNEDNNEGIHCNRFLTVCSLLSYEDEGSTIEYFYNALRGKFNESIMRIEQAFEYESTPTSKQHEPETLHLQDTSAVVKNIIVVKEKHGNIFNNNGFVLFEHILNQYVKVKRGRLSDMHYFYWSMFNDTNKFIHQRPEPFKEWFSKTYIEDLGKIKTFKQVQNPDRDKHYSNALDWFKTQNQ
jgi:hypothetical protein